MPISLIKEEEAHILRVLPILLKKDEQFRTSLYTVFSETFVKKDDFSELKEIVKELALAQKRTEQRVEELAIAQKRTEERVEELAIAQKRTEERLVGVEERLTRLEKVVEELAIAQKETQKELKELTVRVDGLAAAQKRTEERVGELAMEVRKGFKELSDRISSLGSRWGIYNEATFRNTIRGIFKHQEGFE
ncbi:MAG: DUF3782 domain-containing protein, partial [Candidatus Desantisbacteria bacterium]